MKEFTIIDLMKRVNNVKGDFLFKDLFTAKEYSSIDTNTKRKLSKMFKDNNDTLTSNYKIIGKKNNTNLYHKKGNIYVVNKNILKEKSDSLINKSDVLIMIERHNIENLNTPDKYWSESYIINMTSGIELEYRSTSMPCTINTDIDTFMQRALNSADEDYENAPKLLMITHSLLYKDNNYEIYKCTDYYKDGLIRDEIITKVFNYSEKEYEILSRIKKISYGRTSVCVDHENVMLCDLQNSELKISK